MTEPIRVRALPQAVADAIAAGEVVERPAAAVKELCENALDAGATRVEVELEGGGLVRLAVRDNGVGIAAEDLRLAVSRHATSKIASAGDLVHVGTLGFRGEALASIAAVSDLRLSSRPASATAGARIHVRAGEVVDGGVEAMAPGTAVEVADLFANTPARLRFLRSARAETSAVVRALAELVLMRPDVTFSCRTDGRTGLRSPGGALREAARAVFGARAETLLEVDAPGDIGVSGAISPPDGHRAARGGLVLGVNGRRIHNRALLFAAEEAYRGLIPAGRHPFGVLNITISAEEVDVNVHPTKREVRFRDEGSVFTAVQRACWAALQASPMPRGPVAGQDVGSVPGQPQGLTVADHSWSRYGGGGPGGGATAHAPPHRSWGEQGAGGSGGGPAGPTPALHLPAPDATGMAPRGLLALGQAGREWLVATSDGDVVLIDPHAAHEKILYAALISGWQGDDLGAPAQLLLVPAVIECDPGQMERYAAHGALIAACGFELEVFGPNLLRCAAVPAGYGRGDVAAMVIDLLDALEDEAGGEAQRRHRLAATVACHAAVRFGDPLGPAEQQGLLDRLVITPGGMTCPHGRPTMLRLDQATLRRAFGRPPEWR